MKIQFIAQLPDGSKVKETLQVATTDVDPGRNEKCREAVRLKYPDAKMLGWIEVIE